MKTRIHAIAGGIGFLTILVFMSSTILSELFGSHETISAVKKAILWGLCVMIPAMAVVGGSGFSLAAERSEDPVPAKKKRMPIIGANGLLVLVPMAFVLEARASSGQFDTTFYIFQGVELIAGALNLTLMGLNIRDGLALTGRGKPASDVRLVARKEIASGTMEFQFARPKRFDYQAGQWARVTLPNLAQSDGRGNSRPLSIVSAPHEENLTFATRMSDSPFKSALKNLPDQAEVSISGPNGTFVPGEASQRSMVFIAGGIGITPFISMIRDAVHKSRNQMITLFYSNRDPEASAYLAELEQTAGSNANFKLVPTMTGLKAGTAWNGETSFIDEDMLKRHLPDVVAPIYYCVGPPGMVAATKDMLESAGVAAEDIIIEKFTGY